jgi:hypothetical protein
VRLNCELPQRSQGNTTAVLPCSIMVATVPELLHRFDNKDKGNCAVFQEFLVPPMNPKLDGYDLRGLKCR